MENRPLSAKPLITPSPYDGKTSWDDYQVQFELISELNGWNTATMAIYLVASLSGCAQVGLADLDANSRRNYQALTEALSLRFGNGGKMEVFGSQLKSTRGKDESLPELAQSIQRLVRQAYPEAPLSVREVLEKDFFVDAIVDADICWKTLQTRPGMIQEALPVASCMEWSTLVCGAREMSAEGISGTVASLGIFWGIAQISVTTRETKADRTKGPKFGPASLSTAPAF